MTAMIPVLHASELSNRQQTTGIRMSGQMQQMLLLKMTHAAQLSMAVLAHLSGCQTIITSMQAVEQHRPVG